MTAIPTPLECYELCVQSPRHVAAFLAGVHGQRPTTLREDCCGTAAVSRRWVEDGQRIGETRNAVAVDHDRATLATADRAIADAGLAREVVVLEQDCFHAAPATLEPHDACDVIFLGNFSLGYIHTRDALVTYLASCKRRLGAGNAGFGGGVFVCDLYGGANAFTLGSTRRVHPAPGREIVHYLWEVEEADPRSALVTNAISFRVVRDGEVVAEYPRCFVYRWRLWSLPELADAAAQAGFSRGIDIYTDINTPPGAVPTPIMHARELPADWIVCLAARA